MLALAACGGAQGAAPTCPTDPGASFLARAGPVDTLLIAAEGQAEDSHPGAVFSYDVVSGRFATLARPRDPDQVVAPGSTVFVAAHGDRDMLAIQGRTTKRWATGAAVVDVAPDPSQNLLVLAVNAHE